MNTPTYELTKGQIKKIARCYTEEIHDDAHFKARAKKERRPWGILKRDWILTNMKFTDGYQLGLGQGRVDQANGLSYAEKGESKEFNMGYHNGFTSYNSDRRGWDAATRERFDTKYIIKEN